MTAQIPDTFLYEGEPYHLVALRGQGLITPQDYQMQPTMIHTACYRGFYSTYAITGEGLFLTEMTLRTEDDRYKPIEGVQPQVDTRDHQATYSGLHISTPFTGTIRLGKDFIEELYIHMGYQKATAFETVIDFVFDAGKLVSRKDISERVAEKRGAFKRRYESGDMMGNIDDAFSLDLDIE